MSEYRSKSESESVLASVRRLVAAEPLGIGPAAAVRSERLLLTPSLRVSEETSGRSGEMTMTLEQRIAELEAAVSGEPGEWEPDGSEAIDEETPHRFVFQHSPIEMPPEDAVILSEPAEAMAEPEAELAEEPEAEPEPEPVAEPEPEPQPEVFEASSDETVFDAEAVPAAEDVSDTTDKPRGVEIGEDMVVDEDMLRDLVSEIVRSELQGELGERITRNVRKLVRREIHRAIMTRDFD
ncbi:MAG: hypothetical protein HKO95_04245 [Rhodobacteraceae bacterium]|nr:hypothetical protein [Paracoccaceae bacterium]